MPTSGRSGGTSRRRITKGEAPGAAATGAAPSAPIVEPVVELLDDHSSAIAAGSRRPTIGRSLTGAIVGTLLVFGLAFGAALGPDAVTGPADDVAVAGHEGGSSPTDKPDATNEADPTDKADPTEKPDATDGDHPDATKEPGTEPTPKPEPKVTPRPTEKPDATPKPAPDQISLELAILEYHPKIWWGSCDGLDFDYYKVVRSTNSTVAWPPADGDEMIAAIERGGTRKAYDKNAPHGHKAWYRVFCVRKTDAGYKVVNSSATKGIEVPEEPAPPPTPDPIELTLEAGLTDGGKVLLDWSACEVEGFVYYKVLRSTWTEDPSYLPWHDGTEVVGVVSEMGATQLEVPGPGDAGTAWYRVQCLGYVGDTKVLLGESAVVAVTVP